jgi:formylglycine-generating enzyme
VKYVRRALVVGSIVAVAAAALLGCPKRAGRVPLRADADANAAEASAPDATAEDAGPVDSGPPPIDASDDARELHKTTQAELLQLLPFASETKYMAFAVGPSVGRMSQGNPDVAQHSISKKACLEGLRGIVIQTEEQRRICGADNMVPIYRGGDITKAKTCIDVFEFPNQACELPFVWGSPAMAEKVCELGGKRLCADNEWNLACKGDPEGGSDSIYAYGEELDMTICNTNKPHPMGPDGRNWICWVKDAETAWKTCGSDTEPSGSFPRCRSRFGVFDQHGNVAEMMTRKSGDVLLTQLKGSAFFYVDVARKHNEPHPKGALHDTYPDHCNYDPRWHVENLDEAQHTNYHLGFRCCKNVPKDVRDN